MTHTISETPTTPDHSSQIDTEQNIMNKVQTFKHCLATLACFTALLCTVEPSQAAEPKKSNILVLWGDDIGWWNISAYNHGQMGYKTPNIDRIIKEGAMFTDWYGQLSCTAGRSCFITGQTVSLPLIPSGLESTVTPPFDSSGDGVHRPWNAA